MGRRRTREEFKQAKIDDYFRLIRPQINTQTKEIIKCIHVNINGLNAKKYKVIQFLQEEQPDVLALTETHLKEKEFVQLRGYE